MRTLVLALALLSAPAVARPADCGPRKSRHLTPAQSEHNLQVIPRAGGYDAIWLRVDKPKHKGAKARFFTLAAQLDARGVVIGQAQVISEPALRRVIAGGGGLAGLFSEFDGRWQYTALWCPRGARCERRALIPTSALGHGSAAIAWSEGAGEYGVVVEETTGSASHARNRLVFHRLDESLRLIGDSRRVLAAPKSGRWLSFSERGPGLVATAAGFAVTWAEGSVDPGSRGRLVFAELSATGERKRRVVIDEGNFLRAALGTDGDAFVFGYTVDQRARAARLHGDRVEVLPLGNDDGYQGDVVVTSGPGGFALAWSDAVRGARWARLPTGKLSARLDGEPLGDKTGWPMHIVEDACGVIVTTHEGRLHFR